MTKTYTQVIFIFISVLISTILLSCASNSKKRIADPAECMKFLFANDLEKIKEYADDCVSYKAENNVTMLMMAASKGNIEIARFLLEQNSGINVVNNIKQNALHYAVIHRQPLMVEMLRLNGAEIKSNSFGITSLMIAIQLGDLATVEAINPGYEDINILADDGWSAIYFAIRKQDAKILDLLIERGACVNFKDKYNQTPVDFAKEVGWKYAQDKLKNGKLCDQSL